MSTSIKESVQKSILRLNPVYRTGTIVNIKRETPDYDWRYVEIQRDKQDPQGILPEVVELLISAGDLHRARIFGEGRNEEGQKVSWGVLGLGVKRIRN